MKLSEIYDFFKNRVENLPKSLIFQADNAKLYKNNLIIKFFKKLVNDNWFKEVYIHYNIPGHTKFSPDRIFGVIKKYLTNSCIIENYEEAIDGIK